MDSESIRGTRTVRGEKREERRGEEGERVEWVSTNEYS